jgi:hypothetical protein
MVPLVDELVLTPDCNQTPSQANRMTTTGFGWGNARVPEPTKLVV